MNDIIYEDYDTRDSKILQIKNVDEIRNIVYEFDKVFKPSLSERISDLNSYAEKLYNNAIVFAAKETDEYLGFIAFYANDTSNYIGYLSQIAVKSKAQNRKIGTSLIDICIEVSRVFDMKYIKLEVYNNNEKAINLYKKKGFELCGEASADSIYMIKSL